MISKVYLPHFQNIQKPVFTNTRPLALNKRNDKLGEARVG